MLLLLFRTSLFLCMRHHYRYIDQIISLVYPYSLRMVRKNTCLQNMIHMHSPLIEETCMMAREYENTVNILIKENVQPWTLWLKIRADTELKGRKDILKDYYCCSRFPSRVIQLLNFAYKRILNKPHANEVTLTGQNPLLKCCQPFELLTQLKKDKGLWMLKIWCL